MVLKQSGSSGSHTVSQRQQSSSDTVTAGALQKLQDQQESLISPVDLAEQYQRQAVLHQQSLAVQQSTSGNLFCPLLLGTLVDIFF